MDTLAFKKCRAQLLATQAAIAELEMKVEERRDEIKRLENHIELQEKREKELSEQLQNLKEN